MRSVEESSAPEAKDLSHHLSRATKSRQASSMKSFYKYFAIPGVGQLAGGLPNNHYFPYDTLEAKTALPDRWTPTPNTPVDPPPPSTQTSSKLPSEPTSPQSSRLVVPKECDAPSDLRKIDLVTALQYGTAQGYPPLYYFIREFTRNHLHPNVPYKGGPEIILTCGATDGFGKCITALSNEWSEGHDPISEREGILCEHYCYMNAIQAARPRGVHVAPVGIDDEGMRAYGPGGLQDVLENWDFSRGKRPHLMYTVTIGQNPTGRVLSAQRRQDIYALCQVYDVIIIEDDPYWYLQYPTANPNNPDPLPQNNNSGFAFLDSLVPSYLNFDPDGRVLRLDTFSKTVAPGCRLGWITGQPRFIERILRITETSTQQPSGFVQSMIAELLLGPPNAPAADGGDGRGGSKDGSGWAMKGWVRWLEGLRGNYERRMNAMCDILDAGKFAVKAGRRHSLSAMLADSLTLDHDEAGSDAEPADAWSVVEKTQMFDFDRPLGGMFVWLRFDFAAHPLGRKVAHPRLARALWILCALKPFLVLVSPGALFAPTPEILAHDAWQCFRLCFAAIDIDKLEEVSERFVRGCQAFWRIKRADKIDELLRNDEEGAEDEERVADAGMGLLTGFC